MKLPLYKQLFVSTIVLMLLSLFPSRIDAQSTEAGIINHKPKGCTTDRDCGGRSWRCFLGTCIYTPFSWVTRLGDLSNNDKTDFSSVQYSLESDGVVSISLYDVSGHLIRSLVDEWMPSGDHDLVWNEKDDIGNTLNPGVYLLTFQAGDISETTRVMAF